MLSRRRAATVRISPLYMSSGRMCKVGKGRSKLASFATLVSPRGKKMAFLIRYQQTKLTRTKLATDYRLLKVYGSCVVAKTDYRLPNALDSFCRANPNRVQIVSYRT
jgi:hypothetical protein